MDLQKEFSDGKLQMEIDPQTGAIRFQGGVFFAYNSDQVTAQGFRYLEEFIPQYIGILLNSKYRDYIAQIIIEGHTDHTGTYTYNLDLSQRRAHAVVKTIFSPSFLEFSNKELLKNYVTANGRASSEPIFTNEVIDPDKSRRVEFKFRLKDDELIKEVQILLEQER
jgi:chemotaxis protein MotB